MDLNEALLIASTPYIPRNTALDDIRQREIESLKEQAVTCSSEMSNAYMLCYIFVRDIEYLYLFSLF
jgi:hypothetical protein